MQNKNQTQGHSLSHIEMLKRKFGGSMSNVINYHNEIISRLANEEKLDDKISILKSKCKEIESCILMSNITIYC